MNFFSNSPRTQGSQNMYSVGDVLEQIPAFSSLYEYNPNSQYANCNPAWQDNKKAQWMTTNSQNVIHTGGEPSNFNFFQDMFPSTGEQTVEGTEVHVQYSTDKDYNIYAEDAAQGSTPGGAVSFTLLRSLHSENGKYSRVAVNGNVYIYEDHQWLRVTAVDTTVDYAHVVTAIPFSKSYTANIRKKKQMMFSRVRIVDGYSCMVASNSWDAPGYSQIVRPFRIKVDWELPIELQRPFKDIMRFGIVYDRKTGKEVDSFELIETTKAREEFTLQKNLQFFLGQKIDNPALVGSGKILGNDKYSGFDGYLNNLLFGGGMIMYGNPHKGFDLDSDMSRVILRQDSLKKTNELFGIVGLPFQMGLNNRSGDYIKAHPGQLTFETFSRSGMSKEEIMRYGVKSFSYMNYTIHMKVMSEMSDKRLIGQHNIPHMGMFMPGTGLKDSKGNMVSAIEMFKLSGKPYTGTYEEIFRDHRKLENGCEKLSGTIAETFMMAVHDPASHFLWYPQFPC